jgi:tetratricopeptide (TPR) repeat protein
MRCSDRLWDKASGEPSRIDNLGYERENMRLSRSRITSGFIAAVILAVLKTSPAPAQTQQQKQWMNWCIGEDGATADMIIRGCTAAIESGILTSRNMGVAFMNRGAGYYMKDQYDRAIADLDKAIRLRPDVAESFNIRGAVFAEKGLYDRAIADYDQAIRLNPQHTKALYNRGIAKQKMGDISGGDADIMRAKEMGYRP